MGWTRRRRMVVAMWTAVMCLAGSAGAQPYFARAQVIEAPEADIDFVNSVAVDGDWAAAGGERSFSTAGTAGVFVYHRAGGVWTLQHRIDCPVTGAICGYFGASVALSGETLAISSGGSNLWTGVIWIYTAAGGTWTLQTTLTPPSGMHLGDHMAMDGNRLVTSVSVNNTPSGWKAYVFEGAGDSWASQELVAPDRNGDDFYGAGVGISGDTICVGAPGGSASSPLIPGAVHVFRNAGGGWAQDGPRLEPTATTNVRVGASCGVDGNTVIVGSPNITTSGQQGSGRLWVYTGSAGVWTLQQTLLPDSETYELGRAVAVRGDGLVAGASGSDSALFYARVAGIWTLRLRDLNPVPGANYGDVAATDGATFMVGGRKGGVGTGVLGVYVPSATPPVVETGPPGPPAEVAADVAGNTVTITWTASASGAPPTGYTVIVRSLGGGLLASQAIGLNRRFSIAVPDGIYVVSIAASNAAGAGPESTPVVVTVPSAPETPGRPSSLAASVSGTTVTFTWNAPTSGGAPDEFVLVAGTTPGFAAPIATLAAAPTMRTMTVNGIPPGSYYARLYARNGAGPGAASNEVRVDVGVTAPPGPPSSLAAAVTGSAATFTWAAPAAGGPVTGYVLAAGTTPGFAAPIAMLPLAAAPRQATITSIPPGAYYVRLYARNAAGLSAASNEVAVGVAAPAPPGAPVLSEAAVDGHTVTLSWAPGAGGTPASYLLAAASPSGTILVTMPVTGQSTMVTGAPSGSYLVGVIAVNGAGVSSVSNVITVIVP